MPTREEEQAAAQAHLDAALRSYRADRNQKRLNGLTAAAGRVLGGGASVLDEFLDSAEAGRGATPPTLIPVLHLAQILVASDRPVEALAYLDECLLSWPTSARTRFFAARAAIRAGCFAQAKAHLLAHRDLNKPEDHLHLEAEFVLRFDLAVDIERLGRDLLSHPGANATGPLLAAQLAARSDDEALAARALAALGRARCNFSLPDRQGRQLERMARVRLLRLLLEQRK